MRAGQLPKRLSKIEAAPLVLRAGKGKRLAGELAPGERIGAADGWIDDHRIRNRAMQDPNPYTPDQDDMPVLPPAIEDGFDDAFGDAAGDGGDKINPGETPDEVPAGQPEEVPPDQTD